MNALAQLVAIFRASPIEAAALEDMVGPLAKPLSAWAQLLDTSSSQQFVHAWVESSGGTTTGLQAWRRGASRVEWSVVVAKYGPGDEGLAALDNWGGPIPFHFVVAPELEVAGVRLTLWLTPEAQDAAGWLDGHRPVKPIVERLSLRRIRRKPNGGAHG